jgi:3-oxoacyl-[acyl-carrier protein] reductase
LGLAQANVHVIISAARERTEIEAVAAQAHRLHPQVRVLPILADVTQPQDCVRLVDTALQEFGRLDILINNAGRGMKYVSEHFLSEPTRFWEVSCETWRMVIDTNVNGPFYMTRAVVPVMLQAGWGRIINISMNHETMRRPGFSPYGPSKAALESATIIWAQDLQDSGITVNALLPGGAAATGMIPANLPESTRQGLLDPAIVVPPLLYLASPASDGMSGRRLVATRWREDMDPAQAAHLASEAAGWAMLDHPASK